MQQQASKISRHVSFTMDLKHILEKQKELIKMELAADIDLNAHEKDSNLKDN
jgi:hypothetical protein